MPVTPQRTVTAVLTLLAALILAAPAAAQGAEPRRQATMSWWSRATEYPADTVSRHYHVKSDLPPEELKELAEHLDHTYESFVRQLSGWLRQNLPATFNVMIFSTREEYELTLKFQFGIDATGSGGMFFSNRRGSALALWTEGLPRRRVEHVIQHEGFHQVAAALFGGNLPPWVNEGLAEYFGEAIMVNGKLVTGQSSPRVINHMKDAIESGEYIPFLKMLQMDGQRWNAAVKSGDARLQYEQAWSMVHFLIHGENGRYAGMFSRFLQFLNIGHAPYDAFVMAFGTDNVHAFEARWKAYAQDAQPSTFLTAMERLEFLAAGLLELSNRDIYPESLEALRTELQKINFSYTLERHDYTTTVKASDVSLYDIPPDEHSDPENPPRFKVEKQKLSVVRSTAEERRLEKENPRPALAYTQNVRPHNLGVVWVRDTETNTFSFRIAVGR